MSEMLVAAHWKSCHSAAWSPPFRELPTAGILANLSLITQCTGRAFLCPKVLVAFCAPVECSSVRSCLGLCLPLLPPTFHHTFMRLCPKLFMCLGNSACRGALGWAHWPNEDNEDRLSLRAVPLVLFVRTRLNFSLG